MSLFSKEDEKNLRWYFAGGLALECSPASNAEAMLEALNSGSATPPSCVASPGPPDHVFRQAALDRQIRSHLERVSLRDGGARAILEALFGHPRAAGSLREWGPYAGALLVSDVAMRGYLEADVRNRSELPYLSWIVQLRSDKSAKASALVGLLVSEIVTLAKRARSVWEST